MQVHTLNTELVVYRHYLFQIEEDFNTLDNDIQLILKRDFNIHGDLSYALSQMPKDRLHEFDMRIKHDGVWSKKGVLIDPSRKF
jgi:hypothetical protein